MKFAIAAVVLLALTMGVQSSIILGAAGPTLQQGPVVIGWGASVPVAAAAGPSLQQGPVVIGWGASAPVVPSVDIASAVGAPGATYVAKTRGAVHAAPLPGHTQSAAAVNVDPAPGTL